MDYLYRVEFAGRMYGAETVSDVWRLELASRAAARIAELEATIAQLEDALRHERRLSRRGLGSE